MQTLSANGRDLARCLADLKDNGHIDTRLPNWAHGVPPVGNAAAHNAETAVSPEDPRDIPDFTEALLMYVFTLDARFRSFEARRRRRSDAPDGVSRRTRTPRRHMATAYLT